jgi:hypothetical protein
MAKTVRSVKNSLKFKANAREGILTVRIGVKKYTLPIAARILSGGNYIFLSIPATSELYQVGNKQLSAMSAEADATEAHAALTPSRKRGRRRSAKLEVPSELQSALKAIPSGFRLAFDADGSARLVRTRARRKK